MLLTALAAPAAGGEFGREAWTDRKLLDHTCNNCHDLYGYYTKDRSVKSWDLTIARMRDYAAGTEQDFSRAEGRRLAAYLASNPSHLKAFTGFDYSAGEDTTPEAEPVSAADETSESATTNNAAASQPAAAGTRRPAGFRRVVVRAPSRATGVAKKTGYLAVAALVVLLLTGLIRKRIRTLFRPIHAASALVLFICLSVHGIVYLAEYGAPGVTWLWFGIISLLVLAAAETVGLFRRHLTRLFIPIHAAGGVIGLLLAVLHWVWIYV